MYLGYAYSYLYNHLLIKKIYFCKYIPSKSKFVNTGMTILLPSWISLAFCGSKCNSSQRFWRKAALLSAISKSPLVTACASRLRYTFEVTSSVMASASLLPKPNMFLNWCNAASYIEKYANNWGLYRIQNNNIIIYLIRRVSCHVWDSLTPSSL